MKKSIYTKVHFAEQTFGQMQNKDMSNLYVSSISFIRKFNNRKVEKKKVRRYG